MQKKQFNSNRGERVASKVQTLVAEILRDIYGDDKIIAGVSLVGADAHGGLQFVRLFIIRVTLISMLYRKSWMILRGLCDLNWHHV